MKSKIVICFLLLAFAFVKPLHAQCPLCKDALLKDYLLNAQTSSEQLQVLHFIDKPVYTAFKAHYPADSTAPLVHALLMGSKDYEEFVKKREALFEFANYAVNDENIEQALRTTGTEITYNHYTKCVDDCNIKTPDKIYAVLTKTDETNFYVKVKFNAGTGSKVWVNVTANCENALVQKPGGTYYTANATVRLNKNNEQEFVFKRTDKTNYSGYKIMVDGKEIAKGSCLFTVGKPASSISVNVIVTAKDSVKKFIRTETGTVSSPNLYKVMSNDSMCKASRGFAKGMWCAVKNTIELPGLPAGKNMYYTNFTKPEPTSTDKKEAAYGKFNKLAGLREVLKTGEGNKWAKIEFITTSGNCAWQWKGDVYEFTEKLAKVQKLVLVKDNFFTVDVPAHSLDALVSVKINSTKYDIKAGGNNKEAMVYLLSESGKHGAMKYVYFVID